jgi:hypothetical protein
MGSPEVITSIPKALTIAGSDSGGGAEHERGFGGT